MRRDKERKCERPKERKTERKKGRGKDTRILQKEIDKEKASVVLLQNMELATNTIRAH